MFMFVNFFGISLTHLGSRFQRLRIRFCRICKIKPHTQQHPILRGKLKYLFLIFITFNLLLVGLWFGVVCINFYDNNGVK